MKGRQKKKGNDGEDSGGIVVFSSSCVLARVAIGTKLDNLIRGGQSGSAAGNGNVPLGRQKVTMIVGVMDE
jgi:hypothetical protein